jgi:5-(carboxyamino)imidazole ribonucleotide mutase
MKAKSAPENVLISVVMGSDSDLPIMTEATKILEEFGIGHELILTSAHRSPQRTTKFALSAEGRGVKVIIVGAGAAAHLAGVIASQTLLPVIGVPIDATSLHGLDALLSTVQMPGGIPVATMAIGKAGAKNAALFAIRLLALEDKKINAALSAYIEKPGCSVALHPSSLRCTLKRTPHSSGLARLACGLFTR